MVAEGLRNRKLVSIFELCSICPSHVPRYLPNSIQSRHAMARDYDPTVVTSHTRVLPVRHRSHTLARYRFIFRYDPTVNATIPRDPLPVSTGHPLSVFTDTSIGVATHIEFKISFERFWVRIHSISPEEHDVVSNRICVSVVVFSSGPRERQW